MKDRKVHTTEYIHRQKNKYSQLHRSYWGTVTIWRNCERAILRT